MKSRLVCETCKHYRGEAALCTMTCKLDDYGTPSSYQPKEEQHTDNVNHPLHYTSGKYEVVDIIESVTNSMDLTPFQGYCLGNVIKYLSRFKHKNGIEDLRKAKWYLDKITQGLEE